MNINKETLTQFDKDVLEGLTDFPKHLPARYFYDEIGDKIFQQIMDLPEYYLTRTELEIFEKNKKDIVEAFCEDYQDFDLIELGAGDGLKTKILLKELQTKGRMFRYMPIDISQNAIDNLLNDLDNEFSDLEVDAKQGEYFEVLEDLKSHSNRKKVIMFLGSNIGNLKHKIAIEFLHHLKECLNPSDLLFVGFDLKKDPHTILKAYNDSQGVTASFNLNLLSRINREMDADFNLSNFIHTPFYDPETGTAKSFLVSTKKQAVYLSKIDKSIELEAWESIHTEISQKYDEEIIKWLCSKSGLREVKFFTDHQKYFANYLFSANY